MLDELRLNARYGDLGPVWGVMEPRLFGKVGNISEPD